MDSRPLTDLRLTDPAAYGAAFADVYDDWYQDIGEANGGLAALAEFVVARTQGDVVIELGVGSGRLAMPLIERGLQVVGIDASVDMLRRCPPAIRGVGADMAALPLRFPPDRAGPTVLCGFNTLFNLHSGERLRRLLRSISQLRATFIVEMMNAAQLAASPRHSTGRSAVPVSDADGIVVSSTLVDHNNQLMVGRHLEIDDGGVSSRPWLLRWVTIEELDDVAASAGLTCVERVGSWAGEPFRPTSDASISVYRPRTG